MSYIDSPIFLCGAPRSGTTLLHTLLDGHQDILAIPTENHIPDKYAWQYTKDKSCLFDYFYRDYIYNLDVAIFANIEYQPFITKRAKARFGESTITPFFNTLNKESSLEFMNSYRKCLMDLFSKNNNSFELSMPYKALAAAISDVFIKNNTFKYFLHRRNLFNEAHAIKLKKAFPKAKFIHILRDPRTRYLSSKSRTISKNKVGYKFCSNIEGSDFASHRAMVSLFSFELAERNKRLFENDYLIIRYEDLILEKKETVNRITKFLDIPFSEILLTPTNMMGIPTSPNSSFKETSKELNKQSMKRLELYNNKTSYMERFLINHYCSRIAPKFGYEDFDSELKLNFLQSLQPMKYEHYKNYISNRLKFRKLSNNFVLNSSKVIEKFQDLLDRGIEIKM